MSAISEDGLTLATTHRKENQIVLWDVQTGARIKAITCPDPIFILCRGDQLLAASNSESKLIVYSKASKWEPALEVPLGRNDVTSLSAATSRAFDGRVYATCGSRSQHELVAIDLKARSCRSIYGPANFDGATVVPWGGQVITQVGVRNGGPMSVFNLDSMTEATAHRHFAQANPATTWLRPVGWSGCWVDNQRLYAGVPPSTPVLERFDGALAVDATRNIGYGFSKKQIDCRRLDAPGSIAVIDAEYPKDLNANFGSQSALVNAIRYDDLQGVVTFRPPLASTLSAKTYLYVYGISSKGAVSLLRGVATFTPPASTRPSPLRFEALDVIERTDHVQLSEDGRTLFAAHGAANLVTAWDLESGNQIARIPVESPTFVLCRGDSVFVGTAGRGTIAVFSAKNGFKAVDELRVPVPIINYITAAKGDEFKGQLLVSGAVLPVPSKEVGRPKVPSYSVITVNTKRDVAKVLMTTDEPRIPVISYDGNRLIEYVITSLHSTGLSRIDDYVADDLGRRYGRPACRLDGLLTPEPVGKAGVWVAGRTVVFNDATDLLAGTIGVVAAGDRTRPVLYGIDRQAVTAYQAEVGLAELGRCAVELPYALARYQNDDGLKPSRYDPDSREIEFRGNYEIPGTTRFLICTPIASTLGPKTYLIVNEPQTGRVYRAAIPAFAELPMDTLVPAPTTSAAQPAFAIARNAGRVAAMALTEDGQQLILLDDVAGRISIWDVLTSKLIKRIECASPVHVISRGDLAFIASPTTGSMLTLDRKKDWEIVDDQPIGPGVFHLSAPRGSAFKGRLLASCGRYNRKEIVYVDLKLRTRQTLLEPMLLEAATFEARGQSVLVIGPEGSQEPLLYTLTEAAGKVELVRSLVSYSASNVGGLGYLWQAGNLPIWTNGSQFVSGNPPTKRLGASFELGVVDGPPLIALDTTRDCAYRTWKGTVTTIRLNGSFTEIGQLRVGTAKLDNEPQMKVNSKHHNDTVVFTSSAASTLGKNTYLFYISDDRRLVTVSIPATLLNATASDAAKEEGRPIQVAGRADLAQTFDRKGMVLLDDLSIRVLTADGTKVVKQLSLPTVYKSIRDRPSQFVALSKNTLDFLDHDTGKVVKTIKLPLLESFNFVAAPTKAGLASIYYVTGRSEENAPGRPAAHRLVVVNETTGISQVVPKVWATRVALDPTGRYLHLAVAEESGPAIQGHTQIDTVELNPSTGGVLRDLKPPQLLMANVVAEMIVADPGAPGRFAWNEFASEAKFKAKFPLATGTVFRAFSFHPTLPFMATIEQDANGIPIKIRTADRWSVEKGRCPVESIKIQRVERICFSADGTHLLVIGDSAVGTELTAYPFDAPGAKSTSTSSSTRPAAAPASRATTAPVALAGKVAKGEIEALLPATPHSQKPFKEMAPALLDSIVSVQSEGVYGSGVIVGSKGFILTSIQFIPNHPGNFRLLSIESQRVSNARTTISKNGPVTVVKADYERGLMLLKVDAPELLPVVHLSAEKEIPAGTTIAAIGCNNEVLRRPTDFPMFDGKVAAATRLVNGRECMQLDLSLLPTFLGAGVFDSQGSLVGLVRNGEKDVSRITFAVSLKDVREFLTEAVDPAREPTPAVAHPDVAATPRRPTVVPEKNDPIEIRSDPALRMRRSRLIQVSGDYAQMVFSPDGKRWAGTAGNGTHALLVDGITLLEKMEFGSLSFSPDSKRVAFLGKTPQLKDGFALLVDGKPLADWKDYYELGPPIFSADSRHVAVRCGSRDRRKSLVNVDGKNGREYDKLEGDVAFTNDGRVTYLARKGETSILVQGDTETPLPKNAINLEHIGGHVIYTLAGDDFISREVKDGVIQAPYKMMNDRVISPDGKRLAYKVHSISASDIVVLDGVEQPIVPLGSDGILAFSPNGKRFGYFGWLEKIGNVVVVDGVAQRMLGQDEVRHSLQFSGDGKRVAYATVFDRMARTTNLIVDGVHVPESDWVDHTTVLFGPDGIRLAFLRHGKSDAGQVVLDGKPGPDIAEVDAMRFSEDGRHFAYMARAYARGRSFGTGRMSTDRWFLWIDGKTVTGFVPVVKSPLVFAKDGTVTVFVTETTMPSDPLSKTTTVTRLDVTPPPR